MTDDSVSTSCNASRTKGRNSAIAQSSRELKRLSKPRHHVAWLTDSSSKYFSHYRSRTLSACHALRIFIVLSWFRGATLSLPRRPAVLLSVVHDGVGGGRGLHVGGVRGSGIAAADSRAGEHVDALVRHAVSCRPQQRREFRRQPLQLGCRVRARGVAPTSGRESARVPKCGLNGRTALCTAPGVACSQE